MMMVQKHSRSTNEMDSKPFKSKLKRPTPLRQLVQNTQESIQTLQSDDKCGKFIVFEDTFNKNCQKFERNHSNKNLKGDGNNEPSDAYSNVVPSAVRIHTEGNEQLFDGKVDKDN